MESLRHTPKPIARPLVSFVFFHRCLSRLLTDSHFIPDITSQKKSVSVSLPRGPVERQRWEEADQGQDFSLLPL